MIVNQVIPGQEEGNARLIETLDIGAVAEKKKEVRDLVEEAFATRAAGGRNGVTTSPKSASPTRRCGLLN